MVMAQSVRRDRSWSFETFFFYFFDFFNFGSSGASSYFLEVPSSTNFLCKSQTLLKQLSIKQLIYCCRYVISCYEFLILHSQYLRICSSSYGFSNVQQYLSRSSLKWSEMHLPKWLSTSLLPYMEKIYVSCQRYEVLRHPKGYKISVLSCQITSYQ